MAIADVTRELLVRYLDRWLGAVRGARRATLVLAWDDGAAAEGAMATARAAVATCGEFADRLRDQALTVVVLIPAGWDTDGELGGSGRIALRQVSGPVAVMLPAALKATAAAGSPALLYADAQEPPPLTGLTARLTDLLLLGPCGAGARLRQAARGHGSTLVSEVELVTTAAGSPVAGAAGAAQPARAMVFGTCAGRRLEAYKDELWQVDEFAGVGYRDPADPRAQVLDISLTPPTGALRDSVLRQLANGPRSVTELRDLALTATMFRATDLSRELRHLLHEGVVTRDPAHGRLGGDALITRVGH